MFIWVTLPEGMSALKLFHKAMEKKVAFVPGDPFYVGKSDVNTFRLNYTNSTDEVIREGIKRLGEVIKEAMAQSGNIPPTLIKNQGERVSIFVARDLNFSQVYGVKRGQNHAAAMVSAY